jgi:hypothetical protein
VIDEAVVQELLDATEDDAALVLLEGRAQVVDRTALDNAAHGAAVLLSRAELMDRLGTPSPAREDVARVTASLRDAVGKLGA